MNALKILKCNRSIRMNRHLSNLVLRNYLHVCACCNLHVLLDATVRCTFFTHRGVLDLVLFQAVRSAARNAWRNHRRSRLLAALALVSDPQDFESPQSSPRLSPGLLPINAAGMEL